MYGRCCPRVCLTVCLSVSVLVCLRGCVWSYNEESFPRGVPLSPVTLIHLTTMSLPSRQCRRRRRGFVVVAGRTRHFCRCQDVQPRYSLTALHSHT